MLKKPIYLDYQATTPLDPRVLDAMMPYLTDKFGNPHSASHKYGWEGEVALDIARENVAALIHAQPDEIIFTSGATEANNLAIKGLMPTILSKKPHIITVVTEHKCVLESIHDCMHHGVDVTFLPVGRDGIIDLDQLEDAITDNTGLISVMAVNNEIGVIQPLAEIGQIAKQHGVLFHSDAAQAFGKIDLNPSALGIDLMAISAHKAYGPKGCGALYCSRDTKRMLRPHMSGGGQEGGMRSGTQSPALVAGLGKAAELCHQKMTDEGARLQSMMTDLKGAIRNALPNVVVIGSEDKRWAGNINLGFPGINGDLLQAELRDLALSAGSACSSAIGGTSYVLEALGLNADEIEASFRIGIGRFTTQEEIDFAAERIIAAVRKLDGTN